MKFAKRTDWEAKMLTDPLIFRGAQLSGEDFSGIAFHEKDFQRAFLRGASFINCDLTGSSFADADLADANFRDAKLENVDFSRADLSRTNFYRATLLGSLFIGANVFSTNFREAQMGQTVFANLDMEACVGLDTVNHKGPSSVGVECLYRSGSNLPMNFLSGIGFSPILLDFLPSLIEAGSPIQFHSCFISYSHTDEAFARRLWSALRAERIRVWYAPEEMKGGKKLYDQIDRAIQMHDKLLVVLSEESIKSNWVETEIRRARKREVSVGERKLFPIRVCEMDTLKAWECFDADAGRDLAAEVREYFIPDFSDWKKPGVFEKGFHRLSRDLRREGVKSETS